jgi:hypothetical protein
VNESKAGVCQALCGSGSQGHVSTTGVRKSEKKEARARARYVAVVLRVSSKLAGGEHRQSRAKRAAATAAPPCQYEPGNAAVSITCGRGGAYTK